MNLTPDVAISFWKAAAEAEIGIAIQMADPSQVKTVRERLYKARAENPSFEFENIMIVLPGGDRTNEVWLIKKTTELED